MTERDKEIIKRARAWLIAEYGLTAAAEACRAFAMAAAEIDYEEAKSVYAMLEAEYAGKLEG